MNFPGISISGLLSLIKVLAYALICKIIVAVLLSYREYMPPNFEADFLQGRERYFFHGYHIAFYAHITSGPLSLLLGLLLVSSRLRERRPEWHRFLGRIQTICVLMVVTPSGLWMAWYAESGAIAGLGFTALALATGVSVAFGWRAAINRQFAEHRLWMSRCFVLLCSAVALRVVGGSATSLGVDSPWLYPIAAWSSWLLPLAAWEFGRRVAI